MQARTKSDSLLVVSDDERPIVNQLRLLDEPLERHSTCEEGFGVLELKERKGKVSFRSIVRRGSNTELALLLSTPSPSFAHRLSSNE